MLGGDSEQKQEEARQPAAAMQQETLLALSDAGLGADYQTLPRFNFRNLASEQDAERSLQLLDTIYSRVTARATAFFNPTELAKFAEFRVNAINANRLALVTARKIM